MNTSLVYVLTCDSEATYIEQALMAVWSARYWNSQARIVLLTDDKTTTLLHSGGIRGEILKYIDEEIVSTFPEYVSMLYRSRWIKTKVRELVNGDILFIDIDTICCRSLADVDTFTCEVGAVPESLLPVAQFHPALLQQAAERCSLFGVNIAEEEFYWCSGVIYAKDTPRVHALYSEWHQLWKNMYERSNVFADQPPLARANVDNGHIISQIPDSYDNITFTQNPYIDIAHILHISSYRNTSFLFSQKFLDIVKEKGLSEKWMQYLVLHPACTFLPFDSKLLVASKGEISRMAHTLAIGEKIYAEHIDNSFASFPIQSKLSILIKELYKKGWYRLASTIWIWYRLCHVYRKRFRVKENVCAR